MTGEKTQTLAKRIVHLIGERERSGMDEALLLLNRNYPGQPQVVARAYEIACLVVVKQLIERGHPDQAALLSPDADWLAIRAAQSIQEGKMGQAFSFLRIANTGGARPELCRSVVFQLLRGIENTERVTELHYTPTAIISLEVGRVAGSGLVLVKNTPSPRRMPEWLEENPCREDQAPLFFRNMKEIASDAATGCIEYRKTGKNSASLGRINWSKYFELLSAQSLVQPKLSVAA